MRRRATGWITTQAALLGAMLALSALPHAALGQAAAPVVAPAVAAPWTGRDLPDRAAQIESLLARGQSDAAISAGRALMRAVTQQAGFTVSNARLTVATAEGFGIYEPRPGAVYQIGEPVYAYVEVNGFTLTPQPDGRNQMLFDVSFTLDSPDGHQMTDAMIPMGEVRLDSYSQPLDAFFHLTYRVTGAEGPFLLRTEVVDRVSGQVAQFVLPVEFRADPPPPVK